MSASASIIIPTYQRPQLLERLLEKLDVQTYPADLWEVLVVDDDPSYQKTINISQQLHKFPVSYFQQAHSGPACARNLGALHSQGDILIFLDDDVIVEPEYIEAIISEHLRVDRALVMGAFTPPTSSAETPFHHAATHFGITQDTVTKCGDVSLTNVVSHNLSIKSKHFFDIGCFQDPTGGLEWPYWDDIDLAYRAYRAGFVFRRVDRARGSHLDYKLNDFQTHCMSMYKAGRSARALFAKFPELEFLLPMFRDKTPIRRGDTPGLVARKSLRFVLALPCSLIMMEFLMALLEKRLPDSRILRQLYRWINSSYIYKGYYQYKISGIG